MVSDKQMDWLNKNNRMSLNPCSNGIWSRTLIALPVQTGQARLNPCFNGI